MGYTFRFTYDIVPRFIVEVCNSRPVLDIEQGGVRYHNIDVVGSEIFESLFDDLLAAVDIANIGGYSAGLN